jgi:putative endonuclease
MHFIYILYSESAQKFYVGFSKDPWQRLLQHNTSLQNTYTSKYRPWMLRAVFQCGEDIAVAMDVERFIKAQKSKKLLDSLCDAGFVPTGKLSMLVRVPHLRD